VVAKTGKKRNALVRSSANVREVFICPSIWIICGFQRSAKLSRVRLRKRKIVGEHSLHTASCSLGKRSGCSAFRAGTPVRLLPAVPIRLITSRVWIDHPVFPAHRVRASYNSQIDLDIRYEVEMSFGISCGSASLPEILPDWACFHGLSLLAIGICEPYFASRTQRNPTPPERS
jgi:hypothetical protein